MSVESVGEFCRAVLVGPSPSGKTNVWRIESGPDLGFVKWHGAWRCYAFFPSQQTIYEPKCLRAIADFCEAKTKVYRRSKL